MLHTSDKKNIVGMKYHFKAMLTSSIKDGQMHLLTVIFHMFIKVFWVVKEVQATWLFSSPNILGQLPGRPNY